MSIEKQKMKIKIITLKDFMEMPWEERWEKDSWEEDSTEENCLEQKKRKESLLSGETEKK